MRRDALIRAFLPSCLFSVAACGEGAFQRVPRGITGAPSRGTPEPTVSSLSQKSAIVVVSGATYTTFDAAIGGCRDSKNGVNCNNYESKPAVYMSGGPSAAGLSDGEYFFAVLTPGTQRFAMPDGSHGNLSDTTASRTQGDSGGGDLVANRTFRVEGHEIVSYSGGHALGTSPNGRKIIALAPFDDTDNPGGVYILAVCASGATSPSECKYDAFRLNVSADPQTGTAEPSQALPVIRGMKYYDRNANGRYDAGEVGIGRWPIVFRDGVSDTLFTEQDGRFEAEVTPDTYFVAENTGEHPWLQTGNIVDQTSASDTAAATLNDKTYTLTVSDGGRIDNVYFGNLCLGAGGGRTLGFWIRERADCVSEADLRQLTGLALRDAAGRDFDPCSYDELREWLVSASTTNMAYMLSAQLAVMRLNVNAGFVRADALVHAPGTRAASESGFARIEDLLEEAHAALVAHCFVPENSAARAAQKALMQALDDANRDTSFVMPGPAECPRPMF